MIYIKPYVKEDKKGINEKKQRHLLFCLAWYPTVGEKTYFRERKSNFSLDFPVFGPSVLVGGREEVGLRCKGYVWIPILWSFDNSGR